MMPSVFDSNAVLAGNGGQAAFDVVQSNLHARKFYLIKTMTYEIGSAYPDPAVKKADKPFTAAAH